MPSEGMHTLPAWAYFWMPETEYPSRIFIHMNARILGFLAEYCMLEMGGDHCSLLQLVVFYMLSLIIVNTVQKYTAVFIISM